MTAQRRLLGGPDFARLFDRVRRRLEREPDAPPTARVSLRDPTDAERTAIGGLVGRRFRGRSVSVALGELDAALQRASGRGLRPWLEQLGGRLRDRPAEERARQQQIAAALARARQSPLATQPWYQAWLAELEGAPLTRLANEGALERLDTAATVLARLPADDAPIALFASATLGSTKALDDTPVERLVLRGLALRAGLPRPTDAASRRALWERFGVVPDDLAAQVLVLNLPATGDGPVDRMLREGAAHGLPLRLTLHQLTHHPPALPSSSPPSSTPLFICENPAVLRHAAERLGSACRPLVVTEGRPSTALWRLLACTDAPLRVRADFDKDGLEIAGQILLRHASRAAPWRFDADTYRDAPHTDVALPDMLPATPWDRTLRDAMAGAWRVEEEQILERLLGDLAAAGDPRTER